MEQLTAVHRHKDVDAVRLGSQDEHLQEVTSNTVLGMMTNDLDEEDTLASFGVVQTELEAELKEPYMHQEKLHHQEISLLQYDTRKTYLLFGWTHRCKEMSEV